jgi:glycosyltransferase involved in cell wall biosynthesis
MQMKSIHITNYYHKESGGISTAYNNLLEAANRRGRPVVLIAPAAESSVETVGEFGKIYYIKANFSPVFDKRYRLMLPWNTYIFDKSPIKAILREEKPDLIEIGEKYTISLMAGLLRKNIMTIGESRPVLVHFSCERMDDNVASFILKGQVSRWLCRKYMGSFNLPMFDFHLANSDYTAEELTDALSSEKHPRRSDALLNLCWRYLRAPKIALKERIFVNQCGVDNETFNVSRKDPLKRAAMVEKFGLPEDSRILLYAGRISPEKKTDLLVDLMNSLNRADDKYCMLIAGSGPSLEDLQVSANGRLKNSIKFLGHIDDKSKLADLYANSDAFIHTNPNEPFGIAPLEALASGLPLVAPASGGVLSYANANNSWLTIPNGPSFAMAVRSVFAEEHVRQSRVAAGLETSSKYTWQSSTDRLFAIYDDMVAKYRSQSHMYDYRDFPAEINFAANLTAC